MARYIILQVRYIQLRNAPNLNSKAVNRIPPSHRDATNVTNDEKKNYLRIVPYTWPRRNCDYPDRKSSCTNHNCGCTNYNTRRHRTPTYRMAVLLIPPRHRRPRFHRGRRGFELPRRGRKNRKETSSRRPSREFFDASIRDGHRKEIFAFDVDGTPLTFEM